MTPAKDLLRAAVYDRVSADRRRDARSVGEQETANVAACDRYGWHVEEVFTDNDRSASRFARKTRPDWERLVEQLSAGRFDVIVLWEPSRGDRELEMWARLLNTCRRDGVLIHITSHDRTYDVRRPRDWRTLAEDGVDSAYESEKVSERIRRGTRARAAEGRPHGKRLFGFQRVYDATTGQLVGQEIHPEQAATVRAIADMVTRGMPLTAIATQFNQEGILSPRGAMWRGTQIKRLILNPAYIGYRTHLGERVLSPEWFPPILDEQVYYVCLSKLTDPARGEQRPSSIKHLLSGLAVCGVCGSRVRIFKNKGRFGYTCKPAAPGGGPSFHVSRHVGRVDEYIEGLVIRYLQHPELAAMMVGDDESAAELRSILAEIEGKRAYLDQFYVQAAEEKLSARAVAAVEAAELAEIEVLERRSRRVRFSPQIGHLVEAGPEQVPQRWGALDVVQRREVIAGIFEKIEILPIGPGRRTPPDEESVRVTRRVRR
ncbi:DNA invertase Pin-like site-specific DNA recombinase [Streptosporangium album]|uniref:DNA invertase Pin-like site-specific DNA recombinase n=1 Tax=Streptosporangium album TaxID=47479 RepID=A0A7W7RYZ9_9ACTN|nr:recombinase family protein [Streptosporangium album]MBB4940682.1 DNA invertase Pin-like site-specific DNA recombinase [Streptosporangium album]